MQAEREPGKERKKEPEKTERTEDRKVRTSLGEESLESLKPMQQRRLQRERAYPAPPEAGSGAEGALLGGPHLGPGGSPEAGRGGGMP